MARHSAGLLLYRLGESGVEVLLVHPGGPFYAHRDDGVWSVPKGEIEQGEDPLEVALREFEEELGTAAPVDRTALADLGTVRQKGGKVVAVWCARSDFDAARIVSMTFSLEWPPRSGQVRAFAEVDRAGWFSLTDARLKLVSAQAEFIDRLETRLELVR
jgi:predicted NUDIX family NTP pyrophosphohydrolase